MADRSGTLGLLAIGVAGAIAVPVVLGNAYAAWRASVERSLPPAAAVPPAPVPAPPPPAVPAPEEPAPWPREVDGVVFGHVEGAGGEQRDVSPEAPYRVDLSRPAPGGRASAATVDLDRDGRWDERWSFAADGVTREVSPADDGRYTERFRWSDDRTWMLVEGGS